jgi:hypothetical protein
MTNFTIANEYTLPSHGQVYNQEINPTFKLRSMTTLEEMKRLNHSDKPNKNLAEIVDDCLLEPIGISAYDLCIPDFQYVLHKLRIVTYGPTYKLSSNCPWCSSNNINSVNLDELNFKEFDYDTYMKYSDFELPSSKVNVRIKMQTPRMLDNISTKIKEIKRKNPMFEGDPTLLCTLEYMIESIDDRVPEKFKLPEIIKKLPMMDTNYILKSAEKLNESFGLDKSLEHTCSVCGFDYTGNFRTTTEFFGPSID